MTAAANLVLIRHGESEFNVRGLATGWTDVSLTASGRKQASTAGQRLAAAGLRFDVVYTSMLRRAEQTATSMLDAWDPTTRPPVTSLWQLNERHLGQLQGLDKPAIKRRWGNSQRHRWRSDFDALPPPLNRDDPRHPRHEERFRELPEQLLPGSERLSDLRRRVLAAWHAHIVPNLETGSNTLVVAHRDSLRILIAQLEGIDDGCFADIQVPLALPRGYPMLGQTLIGRAEPARSAPRGAALSTTAKAPGASTLLSGAIPSRKGNSQT